MYFMIAAVLIAIGALLIARGKQRGKGLMLALGVLLIVLTVFLMFFVDFWTEALWFDALGYSGRFWTVILAQVGLGAGGLLLSGGLMLLLTMPLAHRRKHIRRLAVLAAAVMGMLWSAVQWETLLKFLHQVPAGIAEPILGMDASFYLFSLPLYQSLFGLLTLLLVIAFGTHLLSIFGSFSLSSQTLTPPADESERDRAHLRSGLYRCAGLFALLLAAGKFFERYQLLYSKTGIVRGAGWTDVNVRLLGYTAVIILTLLIALVIVIRPLRNRILRRLGRRGPDWRGSLVLLGASAVSLMVVWFLFLNLLPGLFQWLRVEPNEVTMEKPYIKNNIKFTRRGFRLHKVEERQFPAAEAFPEGTVARNQSLFDNIRLWDWRALIQVYNQFQEIRLYYKFMDIDIDRYTIDGKYRQVMVSAREMQPANLPVQSQTFVNKRFKYTHGYGITLTEVQKFTAEGLPDLLIQDIPPRSRYKSLEVRRPELYYGELTTSYVVVNSSEKEFDYPKGDKNIYTHYSGRGGVALNNLWRRFLFGWKFNEVMLLLSSYPRQGSRIMFYRRIKDRIRKLAPFLTFDRDPYIVLVDGRLYWIIDAYTTSARFPYSEAFTTRDILDYRRRRTRGSLPSALSGINYIRNAVKIVVDAYHGTTDFYVFEKGDPIVQTWNRIFPNLFKPAGKMPTGLRRHIRYPEDMLLIQGLAYAKYHMTDPEVFYNQEDLWVQATEKYYNRVQPVDPYYILWKPQNSKDPEFALIMPFTPKKKQVLIGWIAGMCDEDNYGRFIAYKFPKDKRILGPQQVETKIDQDPVLSQKLTLWDQRGSSVIRGNVLAIPIGNILLYVEPIYLKSDTAAYPELRLVVLMHNDNMSYGETFDKALAGLLGKKAGQRLPTTPTARKQADEKPGTLNDLIRQANSAFEDYVRYSGQKQFQQAASALSRLQRSLEKMRESLK